MDLPESAELKISSPPSDNTKIFILSYITVIWRRTLINGLLYSQHNNIRPNKFIILNSLRYNLYSKVGLVNSIRSYIVKSITDGFLMPQCYEQNKYVTKVVKLYKKAFDIIKEHGIEEEILFIQNYSKDILTIDFNNFKNISEEISEEIQDSLDLIFLDKKEKENLLLQKNKNQKNKNPDGCGCEFCQAINSWDINPDLIYTEDDFQNISMKALRVVLDNFW